MSSLNHELEIFRRSKKIKLHNIKSGPYPLNKELKREFKKIRHENKEIKKVNNLIDYYKGLTSINYTNLVSKDDYDLVINKMYNSLELPNQIDFIYPVYLSSDNQLFNLRHYDDYELIENINQLKELSDIKKVTNTKNYEQATGIKSNEVDYEKRAYDNLFIQQNKDIIIKSSKKILKKVENKIDKSKESYNTIFNLNSEYNEELNDFNNFIDNYGY